MKYFWMAWFYDPIMEEIHEFTGDTNHDTYEDAVKEYHEIEGSGAFYTKMPKTCIFVDVNIFRR